MPRSIRITSMALLLLAADASTAQAAEPGFRLAGHTGVSSVEESGEFRVSRGTDDLLFVWSKSAGTPRAWRRLEPDAATLVQGDLVAIFEDTTLRRVTLPSLEPVSQTEIAGFAACRGAAEAWSWTEDAAITFHDEIGRAHV